MEQFQYITINFVQLKVVVGRTIPSEQRYAAAALDRGDERPIDLEEEEQLAAAATIDYRPTSSYYRRGYHASSNQQSAWF